MQILSIHNRYQIRGGEDESREAEERLLRSHGHAVTIYEENNDRIAQMSSADVALRTIWSKESYQLVRQQLREKPHDVVHVQNFFPLISPSVHYAAKAENVPVIQTLRNYRLLCANGFFFRDGGVCEACIDRFVPTPAIAHGCYRGSRPASAVLSTMLVTHRIMKTWEKQVDLFIALSEFTRKKYIEGGFPPEKIVVKPNFVDPDPGVGDGQGGYAIFVGRLSPEKGVETLLKAWRQIGTRLPLKLVGEGPLAPQVKEAADRGEVEWLGRRPLPEVYDRIGSAALLVFPTEGYETFGRVAVEAFAKGTPVIAAAIGSIAELVEQGRTGLHFRPGDADDLVAQVEWAIAHPTELQQMRQAARAEYEAKYTAAQNYERLMEIYAQVRS